MKRLFYIVIGSVLMSIMLTACVHESKSSADIVILYTTDVHGEVLPYDFTKNKPAEVSLANASTLIKDVRGQYGKNLMLIDAGDLAEGTPAMYYYNSLATNEQHIISRVVNYVGYDVLVVGNHDLESGEDIYLGKISKELHMPWLAANAVSTSTGRSMFRPYKVFFKDGFKIAVLGLITEETGEEVSKSLTSHLTFPSMKSYAEKWIKEIKNNEHPDYIIGVIHAGIKDFQIVDEKGDTIVDGVQQIVDNVRGFNLVLFGHDHNVYLGERVNQWGDTVKMLQPAAHSEEIGRVDIHFQRISRDSVVATTKLERIKLDTIPVDEDYCNTFKGAIDTVNQYLDTPIGNFDEELCMKNSLFSQTNAMDFVHAVQLDATGAEISFCSALSSFRDIPSGPVSLRNLFTIYRYDNKIDKIWMSGADIKKFLEWGYGRQFGVMHSEEDHLLSFLYDKHGQITYGRFGPDLTTPQYFYTSAAGINYEVDVTRPIGDRVIIKSMADGTPFDMDRHYTVALSSFQAAGGGGFINRGLGWGPSEIAGHFLSETTKDVRYYIANYIRRNVHIKPVANGHWMAIPEAWSKVAGPKDAALLLPYIAK